MNGKRVEFWLVGLEKGNFNVLLAYYFGRIVVDNDCGINLKICSGCDLYACICEPLKLIHVQGCYKYVIRIITSATSFRQVQPCKGSKHQSQTHPLVLVNL